MLTLGLKPRSRPAFRPNWSPSVYNPTVWLKDVAGLTLGVGTMTADLSTWTPTADCVAVASGDAFELQPTATTGQHGIRNPNSTTYAYGPFRLLFDCKSNGAPYLYFGGSSITSYNVVDLTTGEVTKKSNSANIINVAPLVDGWFRVAMLYSTSFISATTYPSFGVTTSATNYSSMTETTDKALVRPASVYPGSGLTIQRVVSSWEDCRANGVVFSAADVTTSPVYRDNGRVYFAGSSYLYRDALAAGLNGSSIPVWSGSTLTNTASTGGTRYVWAACHSTGSQYYATHRTSGGFPIVTTAVGSRNTDAAALTTVPTGSVTFAAIGSSLAIVDSFDGTDRTVLLNRATEGTAALPAGTLTLDRFTIGALRGATVPSTTTLVAELREFAIGIGASLDAAQRAQLHNYLSNSYNG